MKLFPGILMLCIATAVWADPFPEGNAQVGQKMFEQYNCTRCHTAMMGGDGSGIFTRPNRKVNTPGELIAQIGVCGGNVDANFTLQDKQHLAAYLNRYYKFK